MLSAAPSFGQWLRQQRRTRDLTQDAVAERVGCSSDLIRKIEAGVRRPSRQVAELIVRSLEVAPEEQDEIIRLARMAPAAPEALAAAPPGPCAPLAPSAPPPSALIGREHELGALDVHLRGREARLLTLVGPGGVGKTRLALQAAADAGDAFADGLCVVELAPVADPAMVAATIGEALGLKAEGGRPILETLQEQLRARDMLLVLDNFEQLLEAGPAVAALVAACPRLSALVTSRAPLRLYGEQVFAVHPLPLSGTGPGARESSPAVRLFVERARASAPQFCLTEANRATVAAICARLDGLPLALELAAARIRLLSPQALLSYLDAPLAVLTGGPRDLPARQQTLRATIAWSYALLAPGEQTLLARLGVFANGADIDAIAAVCGDAPGPAPELLDSLEALVDQSLVLRTIDAGDRPRFALLETIRAFALEQLALRGEAAATRRRHAAHYAVVAEQIEPHLTGSDRVAWTFRLEREQHNLRAALAWCQSAEGDAATGLRLVNALWWFWFSRSSICEARAWLGSALERGADAPPALRGRALPRAGLLAWFQSDYERALAWSTEGLELCRALGDDSGVAYALHSLGLVALDHGRPEAIDYLAGALDLLRRLQNIWGCAWSLFRLGHSAWLFTPADVDRAVGLLAESQALFGMMGDETGAAHALFARADIALAQGELDHAGALYAESLARCRRVDDKGSAIYALRGLAALAHRHGDSPRARALYRDCLSLCSALRERRGVAVSLEGLAAVALSDGQGAAAVELLGAAAGLRAELSFRLRPAERADHDGLLAQARAAVGAGAFERAWGAGQGLGPERALARAIALVG